MKDDSPFVLAGLWEGWKDPANDEWLHYLHDDHWWIELVRAGDPYPDAGHPTGRASRFLVIWRSKKRGFGPVPGGPNESMAGKPEGELSQE